MRHRLSRTLYVKSKSLTASPRRRRALSHDLAPGCETRPATKRLAWCHGSRPAVRAFRASSTSDLASSRRAASAVRCPILRPGRAAPFPYK